MRGSIPGLLATSFRRASPCTRSPDCIVARAILACVDSVERSSGASGSPALKSEMACVNLPTRVS